MRPARLVWRGVAFRRRRVEGLLEWRARVGPLTLSVWQFPDCKDWQAGVTVHGVPHDLQDDWCAKGKTPRAALAKLPALLRRKARTAAAADAAYAAADAAMWGLK